MTHAAAISARLRRLRRDDSGGEAFGLIVVIPLLLAFLGFATDLGLLLVRNAMLERGVDTGVREIRLGNMAPNDYSGLRSHICNAAVVLPSCESRLKIQLKAMSPYAWEDPGQTPDCESLKTVTVTAAKEFDAAQRNQLVILRACIVVEPLMPGWSLGNVLLSSADGSRNRFYQATATTTYTQEP